MKLQVNFGDGIGVQHIAMAIIMSFSTVIGSDTAINHEMPNINGFCECNYRARACARPRNPNFPMAKTEEFAKPLTPADAPVKKCFHDLLRTSVGRLLRH